MAKKKTKKKEVNALDMTSPLDLAVGVVGIAIGLEAVKLVARA